VICKRFLSLCVVALTVCNVAAQKDSLITEAPKGRNIFRKVIDYFAGSNSPKPAKTLDFSVIGGPYYSQDTKFGIGLVAAGIYRRNLADTINPATQFSIYGDVSITGYYKVGVDGSSYFKGDKIWLYYDAYFSSQPDYYWGIGYSMNSNDDNRVRYKRWSARLNAATLFQVADPNFYVGPVVQLCYFDARTFPDPGLWRFQNRRTFSNVWGLGIVYDTRDNVFNAYSGVYIRLDQLFAPKFSGNRYAFTLTEGTVNTYHTLWRGGVLATSTHARLTFGNTPWGMMSRLGGSSSMRGYWEGRYNDKCAAEVCIELRQHLSGRFGMVAWGGVGEVFPSVSRIFRGHALWNAGVGLRWEFKRRVNVRLDYGFGQHQNGLVFSINEAF